MSDEDWFVIDEPDYEARLSEALLEAVCRTSLTEIDGRKVSVLRTGEITSAAISLIAFAVASSKTMQGGPARRRFAQWLADRVAARVEAMQSAGVHALANVEAFEIEGEIH